MTAIVIDGPEKAGKTTLIDALQKDLQMYTDLPVGIRKWTGRARPNDSEYSEPLQEDTSSFDTISIWDRSWASEYVYGKLLHQSRRLANDAWLGAWLHDRAVQANGLRIMMLGKDLPTLNKLRNKSDLKVSPRDEVLLYKEYAERFGWIILEGYEYSEKALKDNVRLIYKAYRALKEYPSLSPYYWAGHQNADVVFVSSAKSEKGTVGGWLPFTGKMSTTFARTFGDEALKYAWTSAHQCPPSLLRSRKVLVACGNTAQLWVTNYVKKEGSHQQIINVPHPSYLYRYKNERVQKALKHTMRDLDEVLHFQKEI